MWRYMFVPNLCQECYVSIYSCYYGSDSTMFQLTWKAGPEGGYYLRLPWNPNTYYIYLVLISLLIVLLPITKQPISSSCRGGNKCPRGETASAWVKI